MARVRRKPEDLDPEKPNLTPLIDIVFQLIIFFMLVMDMSRVQLEDLRLPWADKAIKEKFTDMTILILNVMKDGKIRAGGKTYFDPKKEDATALENLFEYRRHMRKYQEVPGNDLYVKYPLLIRADASTHFKHVQMILMCATKYGGVTRVQLGAKKG